MKLLTSSASDLCNYKHTIQLSSLKFIGGPVVSGRDFGSGVTLQPLYNTVRYNTDLDITRFKDGSQKCIDYIEK